VTAKLSPLNDLTAKARREPDHLSVITELQEVNDKREINSTP